MHLLRFIKSESPQELKLILGMAVVSGLSNAALLGLINTVAEQASNGAPISFRSLLLYVLAIALYWVASRATMEGTNRVAERRLHEVRSSIADKVAHSDLRVLEGVGRGELFTKFSRDCDSLSQLFPLLINSAQLAVLLIFCALYLAFISKAALVVGLLVTLVGAALFMHYRSALNQALEKVGESEAQNLDTLGHFVEGFQEIRLHADRNDALFERYAEVTGELHDKLVAIGDKWAFVLMFANVYIYGLLGAFVFILPLVLNGYDDTIHKVVAVSMFCAAPLANLVFVAPMFSRAEVSLSHILKLEETLEAAPRMESADLAPLVEELARFSALEYEGMMFSYRDSEGAPTFTSGPWSLNVERGEILFITGGNGSGKSTLLKLLTGLYQPDSGAILVDGQRLEGDRRVALRELFSCIFGDFHLFDRLYGLEHVEPTEVEELLTRFGLGEKVTFIDGRFSTLALSTGQRKRLALVAALLEDRPIYVLDEWAADQDSEFRDRYYTEILPDLAKRGKTVLAVTHDDRYWHLCDRLVKLELGEIVERKTGGGVAW